MRAMKLHDGSRLNSYMPFVCRNAPAVYVPEAGASCPGENANEIRLASQRRIAVGAVCRLGAADGVKEFTSKRTPPEDVRANGAQQPGLRPWIPSVAVLGSGLIARRRGNDRFAYSLHLSDARLRHGATNPDRQIERHGTTDGLDRPQQFDERGVVVVLVG